DGVTGFALRSAGDLRAGFVTESFAGASWLYPIMGKQQTSMIANSPAGMVRRSLGVELRVIHAFLIRRSLVPSLFVDLVMPEWARPY
ncbi:MAG TPA: hypothetical protein VES92_07890, partial [Nitrospiraceae bacterium]|nr:hypothetical protein [Nitrospiraceae bacterium]